MTRLTDYLEDSGTDEARKYTVSNYWPRPDATVENVQGMYKKMVSSESGARQQSTQQNGQSDGQANGRANGALK